MVRPAMLEDKGRKRLVAINDIVGVCVASRSLECFLLEGIHGVSFEACIVLYSRSRALQTIYVNAVGHSMLR